MPIASILGFRKTEPKVNRSPTRHPHIPSWHASLVHTPQPTLLCQTCPSVRALTPLPASTLPESEPKSPCQCPKYKDRKCWGTVWLFHFLIFPHRGPSPKAGKLLLVIHVLCNGHRNVHLLNSCQVQTNCMVAWRSLEALHCPLLSLIESCLSVTERISSNLPMASLLLLDFQQCSRDISQQHKPHVSFYLSNKGFMLLKPNEDVPIFFYKFCCLYSQ